MHRPAVANDRDVAAAPAPIAPELHHQVGKRVVSWRGDDRCNITDAKSETVSDLSNLVFGRCLVGKQIKLPRGLVFLSALVIYAHVVAQLSWPC
jgi:hypothetical protein